MNQTNTQKDTQNCVDKQGTTQSLDQTINRIREECSVDYNLSPQITEVEELIINLNGRVGSNNNPTAILKIQDYKNLKEEFIEHESIFEEGEYEQYFVSFNDIADWWLSKIDELLKSQREEINDNWKSKLKEIHNKCKTERGLSVALLNLIKEQ